MPNTPPHDHGTSSAQSIPGRQTHPNPHGHPQSHNIRVNVGVDPLQSQSHPHPQPHHPPPGMIVPSSSFYDPDHAQHDPDHTHSLPVSLFNQSSWLGHEQQQQFNPYQYHHANTNTNTNTTASAFHHLQPPAYYTPDAQQIQRQRTSELIGHSFDPPPPHQYASSQSHRRQPYSSTTVDQYHGQYPLADQFPDVTSTGYTDVTSTEYSDVTSTRYSDATSAGYSDTTSVGYTQADRTSGGYNDTTSAGITIEIDTGQTQTQASSNISAELIDSMQYPHYPQSESGAYYYQDPQPRHQSQAQARQTQQVQAQQSRPQLQQSQSQPHVQPQIQPSSQPQAQQRLYRHIAGTQSQPALQPSATLSANNPSTSPFAPYLSPGVNAGASAGSYTPNAGTPASDSGMLIPPRSSPALSRSQGSPALPGSHDSSTLSLSQASPALSGSRDSPSLSRSNESPALSRSQDSLSPASYPPTTPSDSSSGHPGSHSSSANSGSAHNGHGQGQVQVQGQGQGRGQSIHAPSSSVTTVRASSPSRGHMQQSGAHVQQSGAQIQTQQMQTQQYQQYQQQQPRQHPQPMYMQMPRQGQPMHLQGPMQGQGHVQGQSHMQGSAPTQARVQGSGPTQGQGHPSQPQQRQHQPLAPASAPAHVTSFSQRGQSVSAAFGSGSSAGVGIAAGYNVTTSRYPTLGAKPPAPTQAQARSKPQQRRQAQTQAQKHALTHTNPTHSTTNTKQAKSRKRRRVADAEGESADDDEFDSNEDEDEGEYEGDGDGEAEGYVEGAGVGAGGAGAAGGGAGGGGSGGGGGGKGGPGDAPKKLGACAHCKKLKMKCEFPPGATTCKRCATGGHACIREARRKKPTISRKQYFLAQIRQKDQIIESLLKQLHNPYSATPLSIASYKMATSPSDKDNINVVDWLDRLQAGNTQPEAVNTLKELRSAAFALDSRGDKMDVGDSDDGGEDDGGEGDIEEEEPEDIPSALPDAAVPIGLLANLSLVQEKANEKGKAKAKAKGKQPATGAAVDDDDNIGVANKEYFLPGPASDLKFRKNLIEQHSPPEIILHGLVDSGDVSQLFDIFWKQVNPFIGLLDPNVHTAESIFARCPFLFTVICAISSRYYSAKSEIYPIAMHFAKHSAANALIDGWKSVELCQAYILMSIYAVPARRWEEDRSWLYTGLAIRIATDLNLHHAPTTQPQNEKQEREILNRARVWMICFNIDRSTATQFGKPSTIKEDYLTRNSADWYKQSQFRDKYDIHLCAYSSLLRIVGRFHDEIFSDPSSPTGLNRQINFLQVTLMHDEHLTHYFEEWTRRFKEESDHNDAGCAFRCTLLPFLVNYSRLVMYSFGFQHAFQRGIEVSDNVFFTKCFDAAKIVIKHMIEVLAPSGFMRSAPDGHFVFASFASAFMLKLLRPEFVQLLTRKMEDEIFELIGRLITTLQEVAIDERHTPRLYARFLAGLLTKHRKGGGGVAGRLQQMPPPNQTIPHTQPGGNQSQHLSFSGPSHSTSQPHDTSVHQGSGDPMQYVATASHDVISTTTTIYRPDTAYTDGRQMDISGPVDVGMLDDFGSLSDTNTLATMHALNEVWWENMMMPGFSWPEAPMMNSNTCNQNLPGFSPGFGGFPPAELNTAAAAI